MCRLPQLISTANVTQFGNGTSINNLLIPIIITIQGQLFEMYSTVSEIHVKVNLLLSVKNFIELEA